MPVKIAINGVSGRMGKSLIEAGHVHSGVMISAAIARCHSPAIGVDSGEWSGVGGNGVPVVSMDQVNACDFDVWIDFTLPEGVMDALRFCQQSSRPMVIGTTGFTPQQKILITDAAKSIPIVMAPNMSVGVNVCLRLLQQAATMLSQGYDVEIIEAHHRHKKDAPSGTALRMGEIVAAALGRDLKQCAVYGRQGEVVRDDQSIGFEVIRAGDIVGEHTVLFAGNGERIEITHKASSRLTFANGALRAAQWVQHRAPAIYDMQDVLHRS